MKSTITYDRWLSLGLAAAEIDKYQQGAYRTIEAAGTQVVGILRTQPAHTVLGAAGSHEEASVIATILRFFNTV